MRPLHSSRGVRAARVRRWRLARVPAVAVATVALFALLACGPWAVAAGAPPGDQDASASALMESINTQLRQQLRDVEHMTGRTEARFVESNMKKDTDTVESNGDGKGSVNDGDTDVTSVSTSGREDEGDEGDTASVNNDAQKGQPDKEVDAPSDGATKDKLVDNPVDPDEVLTKPKDDDREAPSVTPAESDETPPKSTTAKTEDETLPESKPVDPVEPETTPGSGTNAVEEPEGGRPEVAVQKGEKDRKDDPEESGKTVDPVDPDTTPGSSTNAVEEVDGGRSEVTAQKDGKDDPDGSGVVSAKKEDIDTSAPSQAEDEDTEASKDAKPKSEGAPSDGDSDKNVGDESNNAETEDPKSTPSSAGSGVQPPSNDAPPVVKTAKTEAVDPDSKDAGATQDSGDTNDPNAPNKEKHISDDEEAGAKLEADEEGIDQLLQNDGDDGVRSSSNLRSNR